MAGTAGAGRKAMAGAAGAGTERARGVGPLPATVGAAPRRRKRETCSSSVLAWPFMDSVAADASSTLRSTAVRIVARRASALTGA